MRRILFLLMLACSFVPATKLLSAQYAFQVTFTDKNNTPFNFSDPLAYLSPRALSRRAAQGISLDSTDLPVNQLYIDSIVHLTGGVFHESSRWLNMCMILVHDSSGILSLSGISFIRNITLVGYYSTDLHARISHTTSGSAGPLAGMRTTTVDADLYNTTWNQTKLVNGNYFYDKGYLGEGMLIAVLDAGFLNSNRNTGFDSLRQSGRIVDSFDFVWRDWDVLQQSDHGAQVLSTIAGYLPGRFIGAAPMASFALYLTEYDPNDQPLELDNMICAAERADSLGADIITESLGYDIFDYPPGSGQVFTQLDGKTTVAAQAANFATMKGMLFVATAGNDGSPPIPGWGTHILTPGDADSALTIGSTDYTGTPVPSSGYGPNAAGRVKPDVCTMGQGATVLVDTSISVNDGTSFSTPQIAGWAACLWQANPRATPYQIRQAIIRCASSYSSPGPQIGYGVPDFSCTEQVLDTKIVKIPFDPGKLIQVNPTPFTSQVVVTITPVNEGNVTLQITDLSGKTLLKVDDYCYTGYNTPLTLNLPNLPSGIYLLHAVAAHQQQVVRLVKY